MTFVGIGGQAPGGDFAEFVEGTGTGGFTHLVDESGELWAQFGATGQSTFLFVGDDGTFEQTTFGVVGEAELQEAAQRLTST